MADFLPSTRILSSPLKHMLPVIVFTIRAPHLVGGVGGGGMDSQQNPGKASPAWKSGPVQVGRSPAEKRRFPDAGGPGSPRMRARRALAVLQPGQARAWLSLRPLRFMLKSCCPCRQLRCLPSPLSPPAVRPVISCKQTLEHGTSLTPDSFLS